jgi:hypothetical protein
MEVSKERTCAKKEYFLRSFGKAFLSKKRFVLKEKPMEIFLVKVFTGGKKVVGKTL